MLCVCVVIYLFTSELKRIWQTLQEMTGRLVLIRGTPNVWLITAFCTGSICQSERQRAAIIHTGATAQWAKLS